MSVFTRSETYRPFKYAWAVEEAKRHAIDMFWDIHEVDLTDDLRQYKSEGGLETKNVSHEQNKLLVDSLLCLFTELDKTVGEGYTKLLPHILNNEIRNLLMTFAAREVTHQRAYALAAETFGFPDSAWVGFKEYVEMQDKLDLLSTDVGDLSIPLNACKHLGKILLGEKIGLFGAFTSFLNLKRYGILIGFNDVNQWSLWDETAHVQGNIKALKAMSEDLTKEEVKELTKFLVDLSSEYVECENKLLDLLYGMVPQEGLSLVSHKEYIEYIRYEVLKDLNISIGTELTIPEEFEFMEWLTSGENHDNFFEKKVTDYSHEPLKGEVNYDKYSKILEDRLY
jgi:ribonucleotide reductase beta subunit family protein with ferritin-like domain